MSADIKPRRPQSHYWVMGWFGFMTFSYIVILASFLAHRSGEPLGRYLGLIVWPIIYATGSISIVAGGRRRWSYYVVSACFILLTAYSIYYQTIRLYHLLSGNAPQDEPYFVVRQFAYPLLFIGWVYLAARFILGKPSRAFYGLPAISTKVGPPDLSQKEDVSGDLK
jgi:hypothetical protein